MDEDDFSGPFLPPKKCGNYDRMKYTEGRGRGEWGQFRRPNGCKPSAAIIASETYRGGSVSVQLDVLWLGNSVIVKEKKCCSKKTENHATFSASFCRNHLE